MVIMPTKDSRKLYVSDNQQESKERGEIGYELEASGFLSPFVFCNTSKNTSSYDVEDHHFLMKTCKIFFKILVIPYFLQSNHYKRQKTPYKDINIA